MKYVIPYHNNTYNCVQDIVYTLSRFYQCDYQMLLLESWGFQYNESAGRLSTRLKFAWEGNFKRREYLLSKFHGISFVYDSNDISYLDKMNSYLEQERIGIYWDSFYCKWLPSYQKMHGGHLCLVTDYDGENLFCIDQFSKRSNEIKIPKELFSLSEGVVLIKKSDFSSLSQDEYVKELVNAIDYYETSHSLEKLKLFLQDIKNEELLYDEILQNEDARTSKFLLQLKYLANDKLNFIEALDYLGDKTGITFNDSSEYLMKLYKRYSQIRAVILKGILVKSKIKLGSLWEECKNIETEEEKVLESLIKKIDRC